MAIDRTSQEWPEELADCCICTADEPMARVIDCACDCHVIPTDSEPIDEYLRRVR